MKSSELISINDLKQYLIDFFKDSKVKIYLFGSRAKKINFPFSDVNIAIVSEMDISAKIVLLKELLEESNFPFKVDLVVLNKNSELYDKILKEGERCR
ncbi:nucleotidyltransferase family protein [Hippea jasoniae]|uniref:nucleotidyltransferase family protein n=1 Tax=Hippea jasoniae TaxID=944479 RepID=UPI00055498C1|nr:nucleotidyltransferase domain-containing protein [Hippea jasoniae]